MIFNSQVTFTFGGNAPVPSSVTKSSNGFVIEYGCDGSCGYCLPEGDLILIPSNIPGKIWIQNLQSSNIENIKAGFLLGS